MKISAVRPLRLRAKTKVNAKRGKIISRAPEEARKSPTEQLSFADIEPGGKVTTPRRKVMQYTYTGTPVEPTTPQNKFVLTQLRKTPRGITTVRLNSRGVVDPRARIRDLRELGWHIETVRKSPRHVGRYVLLRNVKGGL